MRKAIAAIAIITLAAACSKSQQPAATNAAAAKPAPVSATAPATSQQSLSGTVVETMNSGGYTYLRVAAANGEEWVAVPQTNIAKGAQVTIDAQMTMEKFESKTLNRTFDRIIFGAIARPGQTPHATATMAGMPAGDAMTRMQAPDAGAISVTPAAGGKTVRQLHAQKSSLAGKEVVVRGQVVKSLSGIMGKNWIHLQDGTGSRDAGDHDITITTDGTAAVGDIITVRGVLAVDKDFGSGYRYPVIVEKATIEK